MDNAIRECKKAQAEAEKRPFIILSGKISQNYLVFKCENSIYSPMSLKPEGTGYGLKILKDLANRYSGDFFTKRNDNLFIAQLSLYEGDGEC